MVVVVAVVVTLPLPRDGAWWKTMEPQKQWLHEEAKIQPNALRRGKNLVFSEDTCLEKERMRSRVTDPKKSWSGIETEAGFE